MIDRDILILRVTACSVRRRRLSPQTRNLVSTFRCSDISLRYFYIKRGMFRVILGGEFRGELKMYS